MRPVRMRDRPILFSGSMVRALLREARQPGTGKTQTRRILKPQPRHAQVHEHRGRVIYDGEHRMWCWRDLVLENIWDFPDGDDRKTLAAAQPWRVGDRLWVRETHYVESAGYPDGRGRLIFYRADDADAPVTWTPSIFTPRWASRLTLLVTEVRVERLNNISEADAVAEGVRQDRHGAGTFIGREGPGNLVTPWPTAREAFADIWDTIHGHTAFARSPWVVAITFRPVGANIDTLPAPEPTHAP